MIEQLRSAGDQLRAAWESYCGSYSIFQQYNTRPCPYKLSLELTHQLDIELAFISLYESKTKEIKFTISSARNYLSDSVPVNRLPTEILTQIFHYVQARPCDLRRISSNGRISVPRYPEYLAQVCTMWRRVVQSSSLLWCHIDLSNDETCHNALISRAKAHVAWSGNLPLEIHIVEGKSNYQNLLNGHPELCQLVSALSSRVESFELIVTGDIQGFHYCVPTELLLAQRSNLTKLILYSEYGHSDTSIIPIDYPRNNLDDELETFPIGVRESQVETAFASITTLHLRGIFPLWSSTAYHGLVDLRLLCTSNCSHIREAEFVAILKSSPGLRILHFGLEICESTPATEAIIPAYLQDLQVLKIFSGDYLVGRHLHSGTILRLLIPGSQALRLCFCGRYEPQGESFIELEKFLTRARVENFYIRDVFLPLSLLLRQAVNLERVVLNEYQHYQPIKLPSSWFQVDDLTSFPRLKSLYITNSVLTEREIRLLLECCPDGIKLYSCSIISNNGHNSPMQLSTKELLETFPGVKTTEYPLYHEDDLIADWDIVN